MAGWSPQQYLKFSDLRSRPCRDLAQRIEVAAPTPIIDLGCGPGNLAGIAAELWPGASIVGLDSSQAMIDTARAAHPQHEWRLGDIAQWAASDGERYPLVFSNAALHWLGDHATLFPMLLRRVAPSGALAVQMPGDVRAPQHEIPRVMAASKRWNRWFPDGHAQEWHSHDLDFYYETLAPLASHLDLWATDYLHVMPNVEAIVEFYKATGLRPYLDPIKDQSEKERFLAEYLNSLREIYRPSPAGGVLFPLGRIFIIAYR